MYIMGLCGLRRTLLLPPVPLHQPRQRVLQLLQLALVQVLLQLRQQVQALVQRLVFNYDDE